MDIDALRYLAAEKVDTPAGNLDRASVVSPTGERLGNLDGIVIDPTERRASFLVVSARRPLLMRRYLMPIMASRLVQDRESVTVRVEREDLGALPEMPGGIASFSDDDLLTAMFSERPE
jgi:hypothetical protein